MACLNSGLFQAFTLALASGNKQLELKISPRFVTDDFSILKQSVVDGLGIAVLPDYMCREETQSGKLVKVLPEWGLKAVDVYPLYPQHRVKIPKVKALLEFVIETFHCKLSTH
mgnify:CR=1 FL=1